VGEGRVPALGPLRVVRVSSCKYRSSLPCLEVGSSDVLAANPICWLFLGITTFWSSGILLREPTGGKTKGIPSKVATTSITQGTSSLLISSAPAWRLLVFLHLDYLPACLVEGGLDFAIGGSRVHGNPKWMVLGRLFSRWALPPKSARVLGYVGVVLVPDSGAPRDCVVTKKMIAVKSADPTPRHYVPVPRDERFVLGSRRIANH